MTDDASRHFDNIADRYKKAADTWESVYRKTQETIEPLIQNKLVLDIGNGGYFPYDTKLAKKVIVLDISPAMLEKIEQPNIEKVVGDARTLENIADESVDVILFVLCIHHINGRGVGETMKVLDQVLESCKKKLKKDGQLIIVEPTLAGPLYWTEAALFYLTKFILGLSKVSMIFFFHVRTLRKHMLKVFGVPDSQMEIIPLPITGFVDPLGGSFPGLIRIPGWLCPTRYFLLKLTK